ncbi:hypothetical protein GCM10007084_33270 [Parabacteroides faecis]|nr:hypothetical protein GCM10007084_33270 [Parabacteroides faecis]
MEKINKNKIRDIEQQKQLKEAGWKVLIIWECELKPNQRENTLTKITESIIE